MMRSLWTAASGMIAQQTNVDVIANNLANVNTVGYKANTAEFKSLLYQNMQSKTTTANGEHKPVAAQVGLGVRNSSISTNYTQGQMLASDNPLALAISGEGFFSVMGNDGEMYYTRNGNFLMAQAPVGGNMLTNTDGYAVLDTTGSPITMEAVFRAIYGYDDPILDAEGNEITYEDLSTSLLSIDTNGNVCYPDKQNNPAETGITLGLYQFANPSGLNKDNSSLLSVSDASGEAMLEVDNPTLKRSVVKSNYLEGSNVEVAKEMVNLITAQRAYELNSKAIQAADDMLQQANQLKR